MNTLTSTLPGIYAREPKPRTSGFNVIYDNGIPLSQLEGLLSYSQHIDMAEIGYSPTFLLEDLKERVLLYKKHDVVPFLSGFIFEAFIVRDLFKDYLALCAKIETNVFQISDTAITLPHYEKCNYIEKLSKNGVVYTRVGSKDAAHIIPSYKWIQLMDTEMQAGASLLFAESGEAGNVAIYRGSGEVREGLIQEIIQKIPMEKIVWDAPRSEQQLYFVEVSNGSCSCSRLKPNDLLDFEAMRLGLSPRTLNLFFKKEEKV